MLVLAGLGYSPGLVSREVEEIISKADRVYVDVYTMPGSRWAVEYASRVAGGRVVEAGRSMLEEGSASLVEEARGMLVVVAVPGDPLIATTHVALLAEARRRGVEARYYPGVSGVCAAKAASLLHYYRFGRTVTIPGPWREVKVYSVVEAVYTNLCSGLHTLALLDVSDTGGQLSPGEASRLLLEAEVEMASRMGFNPLLGQLPALLVSAGAQGEHEVAYPGTLDELASGSASLASPGGRVYSLIIPAEPHPTEEWALREVLGVEVDKRGYDSVARVCSLLKLSPRGAHLEWDSDSSTGTHS